MRRCINIYETDVAQTQEREYESIALFVFDVVKRLPQRCSPFFQMMTRTIAFGFGSLVGPTRRVSVASQYLVRARNVAYLVRVTWCRKGFAANGVSARKRCFLALCPKSSFLKSTGSIVCRSGHEQKDNVMCVRKYDAISQLRSSCHQCW